MEKREYDEATARAIFQIAYGPGESNEETPYIVMEKGVFLNETLRIYSPRDSVLDWTPAYDMDWSGAPNPLTAPILPISFKGNELAAALLDGPGRAIQETLDTSIGDALDDEVIGRFSLRGRWVIEALKEAYALAEEARKQVGEFDYDEMRRAATLQNQVEDANREANTREKVFEYGISSDEANQRRARAVASYADLKAQALEAKATVDKKWAAWRKAMVYQLLAPEQIANLATVVSRASDTPDYAVLATRAQLIDAFGSFTGMDASWFRTLRDIPFLKSALKVKGQGGRGHITEPMFCPFEVMQGLINNKRRIGRKLNVEKGWDLLEKNFIKVYSTRSIGDPRPHD